MSKKFITTRALNIDCTVDGKSEMVHLRAGATLVQDSETSNYVVDKPSNSNERKIAINESAFASLKAIKSIVSTEATQALKSAKAGNSVETERKIIDLVNKNQEQAERIEELEEENARLTNTLANFTKAAANQKDELDDEESEESDEDDIPDYNSMTVDVLRSLCVENNIDFNGMKKADLVEALTELHYEDESDEN
jgi:hypothetical protein